MQNRKMNNIFLPKELNKNDAAPICVDKQTGEMTTEMHWHSCAEIIHVQQGKALIFCCEKWEVLIGGDTVFLPPGHLHCCHCTDENAVRVVIGLDERAFPGFGAHNEQMLVPFRPGSFSGTLIIRGKGEAASLCERLGEMCRNSGNPEAVMLADDLLMMSEVQRIYAAFLRMWETEGAISAGPVSNRTVLEIERIIEAEFMYPMTAAEIAARVNISYSHMANLIRWERSTTFNALLLKKRVDAAKKLLLTTELSITEIGNRTGFGDTSYFIKKFGASAGITPHKYRTENRRPMLSAEDVPAFYEPPEEQICESMWQTGNRH